MFSETKTEAFQLKNSVGFFCLFVWGFSWGFVVVVVVVRGLFF